VIVSSVSGRVESEGGAGVEEGECERDVSNIDSMATTKELLSLLDLSL
jgi:hypothetical protein